MLTRCNINCWIYIPTCDVKKAGINATKDMKIVNVKGHDQAVISLLNGDVDAAAVFNDARNTVKKTNQMYLKTHEF